MSQAAEETIELEVKNEDEEASKDEGLEDGTSKRRRRRKAPTRTSSEEIEYCTRRAEYYVQRLDALQARRQRKLQEKGD